MTTSTAPQPQPPSGRRRAARPRWVLPVSVAAVVLLLGATALGVLRLAGDGGGTAPTPTDSPGVSSPAPSGSGSTGSGGAPGELADGIPVTAFTGAIGADPALDAGSEAMVASLAGEAATANYGEFGFPVYYADAETPRYTVRCDKEWGTCPLSQQPVPVPDGAEPSWGSDGAMVVVDTTTDPPTSYEFWQAYEEKGIWNASWGDVTAVRDDGAMASEATGAGLSILSGLVGPDELASGTIDHALTFSTNNACTEVFRLPAVKTDGSSTKADCLPEGARVQLDPGIDLAAIEGITPAELTLGRALQTYGAYVRDNGGSTMAFSLQMPRDDEDYALYSRLGLSQEYTGLEHLPMTSMRVLASWDGAPAS